MVFKRMRKFIKSFYSSVEIHYYDGEIVENGVKRKMTPAEIKLFRTAMDEFQEDIDKMAERFSKL